MPGTLCERVSTEFLAIDETKAQQFESRTIGIQVAQHWILVAWLPSCWIGISRSGCGLGRGHFGRSGVGTRRDREISTYKSLKQTDKQDSIRFSRSIDETSSDIESRRYGRDELREARTILPCIYCGVSHDSSIKLRQSGSPAEIGRAYTWREDVGRREAVSQARLITRLSTKTIPILAPTWGHHCP